MIVRGCEETQCGEEALVPPPRPRPTVDALIFASVGEFRPSGLVLRDVAWFNGVCVCVRVLPMYTRLL